MLRPEILIFEKKPRWTPELQRQFADEPVRVRLCPGIPALRQALQSAAGRVLVVMDLESGPAECLQFLGRLLPARRWPVLVVASKRTADLEWAVRELGVVQFVPQPISGKRLATVCRRLSASALV